MDSEMSAQLSGLVTESRNLEYKHIDQEPTIEILRSINEEDKKVAFSVSEVLVEIAAAVDAANDRLAIGGRIIYVGAGTSGRIAEVDASEIGPTYGTPPEMWIVLQSSEILRIADGSSEDFESGAIDSLRDLELNPTDVVFGIAASGRTPFVIGALRFAKKVGALTISLSNNRKSLLEPVSDIAVNCEVGPEVIYGSTRMKSGTSQKLILNLFSTALMVKQGRTFGNLMSHMRVANEKLIHRAIRIVAEAANCDFLSAEEALAEAENAVPIAILRRLSGSSIESCKRELEMAGGQIRIALKNLGG
jgi:N-acetylmuramic acid 6-phosphate etherase